MTLDRVGRFDDDIAGSPVALARLLDGWRPYEIEARQRIVFTGLGSSRFAAAVIEPLLHARGRTAWIEVAGSPLATHPAEDVTLVAISASGETPEVLDAAARHSGTGPVVAITNRSDSRLAGSVDRVVTLEAGEETAGIACRTFRATIAALALVTGLSTVDGLDPIVDASAAWLDAREGRLDALIDGLDGAPAIDVLGDGPMVGVAEQAALMLREAPRLPAHAWASNDWPHTGVYLAWPGHRVVLFPGSSVDAEVKRIARQRGAELLTVQPAGSDPVGRAIVDSLVMESVAAELWRRTRAQDKSA